MKKQEPEDTFDKSTFDDVLLRKMFVVPSFEIYGGVCRRDLRIMTGALSSPEVFRAQ